MKSKRTLALILTRIGKRKREDTRKTQIRIYEMLNISFRAAELLHEMALTTIHNERYADRLTSSP